MVKIDEIFDNLETFEEKKYYIHLNPSVLLKLDQEEVERIEKLPKTDSDYKLLQELKKSALSGKNSGFLIFGLINNGFVVDDKLKEIALCSCPSICAQCPIDWFTKKTVRAVLKKDVRNIIYIPKIIFDVDEYGKRLLTKFLQKQIREQLLKDPDLYASLPKELVEYKYRAYTSINAVTQIGHEERALSVPTKDIWETNGGKIMFFIARHNVNIALKMLNESMRKTLAIQLVKTDYKSYDKFPPILQENEAVKLNLFYQCIYHSDMDYIKKHFSDDEYFKNLKIMESIRKRNNTIKQKKEKEKLEYIPAFDESI